MTLIEQLRAAWEAACTELHTRRETMDVAQRAVLDAGDDADFETLNRTFDTAATAYDEQAEEVKRTKGNLDDAERRARIAEENPIADVVPGSRVSSVEPPIYSPRSEYSFFADAYRAERLHDWSARERLQKHQRQNVEAIKRAEQRETDRRIRELERFGPIDDEMREMYASPFQFRDVGTTQFGGLTVPQYLIDLYAPLARAGAPLLAAVRKVPLPAAGMTVVISRITTGSAVAAQATETTGAQETDIADTTLTVNVRTYTGQQDVSRQALERDQIVDAVVYQDLTADYFTKLDDAILNGAGTSGTHLGIRSTSGIVAVTFTNASPTLPLLYPKVADCIQQIASGRFAPALLAVMHPRRWGWSTASLDSSNRPLVVPVAQGPFNALAVGEAPEYGAVVGQMQGLPVISDANIKTNIGAGTNQDTIIVVRTPDLLFWQEGDGAPRQLTFEAHANAPASVRLSVWGYSAFTAGRYPLASGAIDGTGLVTPTF